MARATVGAGALVGTALVGAAVGAIAGASFVGIAVGLVVIVGADVGAVVCLSGVCEGTRIERMTSVDVAAGAMVEVGWGLAGVAAGVIGAGTVLFDRLDMSEHRQQPTMMALAIAMRPSLAALGRLRKRLTMCHPSWGGRVRTFE